MRFEITSASFDATSQRFTLTVASSGGQSLNAISGNHTAAVVPAYFRVVTNGVPDDLPPSASVYMQFEAAPADAFGNPDTTQISGPFTDVSQIIDPNGLLRFLRFDVAFDVDVLGQGISPSNPKPNLQYLKMQFSY
jgi:hypothetical protein